MKKTGKMLLVSAASALIALGAQALQIESTLLSVSEGNIVPGVWNSNYDAGRTYADTYHVPLLVFYGGASCGNCTELQKACLTQDFLNWQALYKPVMIYTTSSSGAMSFAKPEGSNGIPYVGIYWNRDGNKPAKGSEYYKTFTGRAGTMLAGGATLQAQLIASLNMVISGYVYNGGEFLVAGTDANDRLEVEAGYADGRIVTVPLVRTSSAGGAGSNTLVVNGVPYGVAWAPGESLKYVDVAIPGGVGAGGAIPMELLDESGKSHSANAIYVVAPVANSVSNPYAIGEKTVDELAWGDWTLDYEAAKAKVAAARNNGESAYLIANFSGVFWCPYCNAAERTLLTSDAFKAWAQANKVIFALFDQGRASTPATAQGTNLARLLSYEAGTTTIAGRPVASGASYLTRKGITPAQAAAGIGMVTWFTQQWLAPGSTAARIGNPTFLLIGAADNVVARANLWRDRNNELGQGNLNYDPAENIARLDDLLALDGGPGERDSYALTTALSIKSGESASCEMQVNTATKAYAVGGVPVGSVDFWTAGKTVEREVTLTIVRIVNGVQKTLATGKDWVTYDFDKGETDNVFLLATSYGNGARVGASSGFGFTISSLITLHPGEVSFSSTSYRFISGMGQGKVTLKRTNGVSGDASVKVSLAAAGGTAVNGVHFGWQDAVVVWEEGDRSDKTVTFTMNTVAEGEEVAFSLFLSEPVVASLGATSSATVQIFNTNKPTTEQGEYDVTLYTGFNAASGLDTTLYNTNPGDNVVVKVLSGRLPAGVKVVFDAKTGNVTFKGTATKAGSYSAVVAFEDKTTGTGLGAEVALSITVADPSATNPYMSRATTMTLPLFTAAADGKSYEMVGAMTLDLKANNKITAKYATKAGVRNITFTGKWDAMENGTAVTALETRKGEKLELSLAADGTLSAEVTDANYENALTSGTLKANDGSLGASFAGTYTVAFPEDVTLESEDPAGAGYVTLNIAASGKTKWTGVMANGQRVSGNATLVGNEEGNGVLALYVGKAKYSFCAPLLIKPTAWATNSRRAVVCVENATATWEAYGIAHRCKAWGSWHNPSESLQTLCAEATLPYELTLRVDGSYFTGSTQYGELKSTDGGVVTMEASKMALTGAERGTRLAYRAKDGVISGTVRLAFANKIVSGKFTGVIIPGWYDCKCDIPLASDKFKIVDSMPLAIGAVYYTGDKINGAAAKRGMPIAIGFQE